MLRGIKRVHFLPGTIEEPLRATSRSNVLGASVCKHETVECVRQLLASIDRHQVHPRGSFTGFVTKKMHAIYVHLYGAPLPILCEHQVLNSGKLYKY